MKTNKKVQTNSVQKSEKENVVNVDLFGNHPETNDNTHTAGRATATEVQKPPKRQPFPPLRKKHAAGHFQDTACNGHSRNRPDITTIHPSTDNHRKTFNDASLQELAESIREEGILQAIAVRPRTEGGYEIIYGERRYRASLLAGAKTIKATIYNNVTDDEAEDMSLSENLQREAGTPH